MKIKITHDNQHVEVEAVELDGKLIVNLHPTTYNLLVNEQGTGHVVSKTISVPNCGFVVKVKYERDQMSVSGMPIRTFVMRPAELTAPLPAPQEYVTFLVSPETRTYLSLAGIVRPDVWSPYSIQEFRLDSGSMKCATALAR